LVGWKALSADSSLEQFSHQMTSYEEQEILGYSQIYFIGLSAVKRSGVVGSANNDGYDDECGSYIQVACLLSIILMLLSLLTAVCVDSFLLTVTN